MKPNNLKLIGESNSRFIAGNVRARFKLFIRVERSLLFTTFSVIKYLCLEQYAQVADNCNVRSHFKVAVTFCESAVQPGLA